MAFSSEAATAEKICPYCKWGYNEFSLDVLQSGKSTFAFLLIQESGIRFP